ncbi:MAG TPA: hypothetical protein VHE61_00775 [Opitutaceae bacterium]|nr:hypothetical protein [Opitutaceae bacterium]
MSGRVVGTVESTLSLGLRMAYAACLLVATITHVVMHVRFGVLLERLPSEIYPIFSRLYWSSLTLLDPLSALLLFLSPRWGVVAILGVIVSDVAHNTWLLYHIGGQPNFMYWCQVGFLVFVVATAKFIRPVRDVPC